MSEMIATFIDAVDPPAARDMTPQSCSQRGWARRWWQSCALRDGDRTVLPDARTGGPLVVDSVCPSVGVGREVASGLTDLLVVPEGAGECEESERDAGGEALVGAGAVAFERELAFAGPE